ncbi:MAG TPA: serine/threonine-protein kinase, partial [Candidatus Xenobia bacterium]
TVIFDTSPEGAQVYLVSSEPELLGETGRPVQVPVPSDADIPLRFVFVLDGYQKGHYEVQSATLQDTTVHHLPDNGQPLFLLPASWPIYLLDQARRHAQGVGFGLAVLAVGVAAWRSRMGRILKQARRAATLDTLGVGQSSDGTVAEPSLVGQRLGNWLLTDRLGKGGMAVVYRGVPNDTLEASQAVAVKVINPDSLSNPETKARFEREVRIGAKLNHPNIVRLIDWDVSGPYYLVMELIDGVPLRKKMSAQGLTPRAALDLMQPVFEAMIYAHSVGVWHRDLKPENVFISNKSGRITVMDFGISRQATDVTVTRTGGMPVTPGYMSPEQFSGPGAGAASDQYSLGIMVWEMVAGHRPFDDSSPMVVVAQHLGSPLPLLQEEKPAVPYELDLVLQRMCAKDPIERFPDLQSAVEALEEAIIDRRP